MRAKFLSTPNETQLKTKWTSLKNVYKKVLDATNPKKKYTTGTGRTERLKEHLDIADKQIEALSKKLAELQEQLKNEQEKSHNFKTMARAWKKRAQEPGPKEKQRIVRRNKLGTYTTKPKLRKKQLRRMVADLDKYIKVKFRVYEDGEEAMVSLLDDNSDSEHVQRLLARLMNKLPHLKKAAQLEVVRRIQAHWTAEVGLAIRLRCRLPERPYQYLIHALSHTYNVDTGHYDKTLIAPGVYMPSLGTNASKNQTIKLMKQYFETAEPEALLLGSIEGITLSFKEAMIAYCKEYLPEVTDING
ncbi:hypothetical protein CYMTET_54885 [Cymbomonas tetramitiformis]|uniref:Uncharacterized protein n=1 Tax=Cymbomonas tetramitiformis TaxID=36881 RepID=A0AAE0ENW9_9CHLO|nr:hypothetical protein CYMTET_54885 [Cymbomonas tetramitiformis]